MGATAGHPLVGRSNEGPSPLIHLLQYDGFMDNRYYPRYPAKIVGMGEWLNTLAHTIIQCQRHSH